MRQGLDPTTQALWLSGEFTRHSRIKVANGSGTFINLFGRYNGYNWDRPNPSTPIGSLSVTFIRETTRGNDSLAPYNRNSTFNRLNDGVTYAPLFLNGREVVMEIALTVKGGARPADGATTWFEVFRGIITNVRWPQRLSRTATIQCVDMAGRLHKIKSEHGFVYTAGTAIETAIPQVILNNGQSAVLSAPVTGKVLSNDYAPGRQKTVWEQVWALAQSIGWLIWFDYTGVNTLQLVLFEPLRWKTAPDYTVPRFDDFTALETSDEKLANVGRLEYVDENGAVQEIGPLEDLESIYAYGGFRRVFWIVLTAESPVRDQDSATDMLTAALRDVVDPDVVATSATSSLDFTSIGQDLLLFPAREEFSTVEETLAPYSISISESVDEEVSCSVGLSGRPTAGAQTWMSKVGVPSAPSLNVVATPGADSYSIAWSGDNVRYSVDGGPLQQPVDNPLIVPQGLTDATYTFIASRNGRTSTHPIFVPSSKTEGATGALNFRESSLADGTTIFQWDGLGSLVAEMLHGSVLFTLPLPPDPWSIVDGAMLPLPAGTIIKTYPQPGENQVRLGRFEARLTDYTIGLSYPFELRGTSPPIDWKAVPSETETTGTLNVTVNDDRGVVSTVQFWTLALGIRLGPFAPTSTGAGTWAYTVTLDPKHTITVQPELVRNDGGLNLVGDAYPFDFDKASHVTDVRKGTGNEILVDSDTDTVSLHFREVIVGVVGAENSIPARGLDPRFGIFSPVPGASDRFFRIYGKNVAGVAGEYVEWTVLAASTVVVPALLAANIGVVNRPDGGIGREEEFSIIYEVSTSVGDADYELYGNIYEVAAGGARTFKTAIGDMVPSDGVGTIAFPVGHSTSKNYSAEVTLYEAVSGVPGKAIGTITTPPRASQVIP
jgi:hypothetical protein